MPEARRRRRWPIVLAIVVVLFVIGALIARHFTRPETLTAMLIDNARSQLGAELGLSETGRFGFLPKLHLTLAHPTLRQTPQTGAFLSADSADVVVPWSILWSDRYEIHRVELVKPRLDLDALDAWLASRPSSPTPPDVRFSLRATDATLILGGKRIAERVNLDFASTGDLIGWLNAQRSSTSVLLPPLSGTAEAKSMTIGDTTLENVRIESREDDAKAASGNP